MLNIGPGLSFLASLAAALGISVVLTAYLASGRSRLRILDHPNERSLHHIPVPRTGGLAILTGLVAGMVAALAMELPGAGAWHQGALSVRSLSGLDQPLIGATLVAVISFADDKKGIGIAPRFAVHIAAAGVVLAGGLALRGLDLGIWVREWPWGAGMLFSGVFLVWMTNLYNFMDGMDGFAAGMGSIGFGFLGLFGWLAGEPGYALICWMTSLSCLGFLVFNFPPARIFMGDTGASTLGFWAGALILWAVARGVFPFWAGVLVFSPFIVDATVTLLRRVLAGEKFWQPHRAHYYQCLVQLGWGHRKTVLAGYAVMLSAGLSGLLLLQCGNPAWVLPGLGLWALLYLAMAVLVGRKLKGMRLKGEG